MRIDKEIQHAGRCQMHWLQIIEPACKGQQRRYSDFVQASCGFDIAARLPNRHRAGHARAPHGFLRMNYDFARSLIGLVVVPPVSLMVAGLLGGLAAARGARFGAWAAALATGALLVLSTGLVSGLLLLSLDSSARPVGVAPPGAILVLGAETRTGPDGPDVGPLTLERLRRAADLQRETHLPLLVTAGTTTPGAPPLAELMRQALEGSFGATVRWVEPAARNTAENAGRSAAILARDGITSVLLVTHAWHMQRAREEVGRSGLVVWPAPVRAERIPDGRPGDWIPRPDHLSMSWFALREWTGIIAQRMGL